MRSIGSRLAVSARRISELVRRVHVRVHHHLRKGTEVRSVLVLAGTTVLAAALAGAGWSASPNRETYENVVCGSTTFTVAYSPAGPSHVLQFADSNGNAAVHSVTVLDPSGQVVDQAGSAAATENPNVTTCTIDAGGGYTLVIAVVLTGR